MARWWALVLARVLCVQVSCSVKRHSIYTRITQVPAEVIVTLGLVQAQSIQLVVWVTESFIIPMTVSIGIFWSPVSPRVVSALSALFDRSTTTIRLPPPRTGLWQWNLSVTLILVGMWVSALTVVPFITFVRTVAL